MSLARVDFGFRGLGIVVRSAHRAPLDWLEEFLSPHFHEREGITVRHSVDLVIDPQRYALLLAEGAGAGGRTVDCFTLDGGFERHALWRESPGGRLIRHARAECFLSVPAGGGVEIVARADSARLRSALMRTVRELATLQALHRGDLLVHGSAAVVGGRALLFAGQKQAGKTTMLLNALRQHGVRFLSNDRVFVELGGGGPFARGVPTIVTIRGDSLIHLPGLDRPSAENTHRYYLTMREAEQGSPLLEPPTRDPSSMSPARFCRWIGVEPVAGAALAAVVFPTVDVAVETFGITPLSPPAATGRLAAGLFPPDATASVPEAFAGFWNGAFPGRDLILQACRVLAGQVACLEARIGPAAFRTPNVWDALVAAAG